MKKIPVLIAAAFMSSMFIPPAMAAGNLVRFEGGIGVDPVAGIANPATDANGVTTGDAVRNDVMGIAPGGRNWVIKELNVRVRQDGRISGRGEGLLLSATNAIGTIGGVTQVVATLFCGGVASNSDPVVLDAGGDFQLTGVLNPLPPTPCTSPVLLIRNYANGAPGSWFAAGIMRD